MKYSAEAEFIYSKVPQFIEFMGIDCMPEFSIQIRTVKELGSVFNIGAHSFGEEGHTLYFPERIHDLGSKIDSMIFHEFTHIIDFETLVKYNSNQFEYIILYTEFRASLVEIKKSLGWESEFENNSFSERDKISFWNGEFTILEEVERMKADLLTCLQELRVDKSYKNCNNALTYLMYYLARVNIYHRYCMDRSGKIKVPKELISIFGKDGMQLWQTLQDMTFRPGILTLSDLIEPRINILNRLQNSKNPKRSFWGWLTQKLRVGN